MTPEMKKKIRDSMQFLNCLESGTDTFYEIGSTSIIFFFLFPMEKINNAGKTRLNIRAYYQKEGTWRKEFLS